MPAKFLVVLLKDKDAPVLIPRRLAQGQGWQHHQAIVRLGASHNIPSRREQRLQQRDCDNDPKECREIE
jgi:hypothetical protein